MGYLSYFLGKIVFGFAANLVDGRFCMNVTIIGAPVLSWVFAAMPDKISLFVAWTLLRFTQASGWVGTLVDKKKYPNLKNTKTNRNGYKKILDFVCVFLFLHFLIY